MFGFHCELTKKYTDVRLVFIPEVDIARFGGDPDNFEFPRFDKEITFLRAYENGAPARPQAYFQWRTAPLSEGELVIVSGHPGRTERLITAADARFLRDMAYPADLNIIRRFEIALQQYAYEGPEQARIVDDELFRWQNRRKAYTGMLAKLQDPSFMEAKDKLEHDLPSRLHDLYDRSFDEVERAVNSRMLAYGRMRVLERGNGFYSSYFDYARTIVRLTEEREKPNAERLREYSEAALSSVEQQLLAEVPIYDELEVAKLGESLTLLTETLGAYNPLVKQVLGGKSPRDRAFELVSGTWLKDAAFRKELVRGDRLAVLNSQDPFIQLAMMVDPESRKLRKANDEAQELRLQAYAKLAELRQELNGSAGYPDATFTLRLSFGVVKGYEENGKAVPITTTFAGLYQRAAEHENLRPWKLPKRWLKGKRKLDLATSFNFVSTNDITGGNSGSPVLDRQGRVVGIIFDGNIQSLGNAFAYSEEQARAVSVSAAGIVGALRKVYGANFLADELGK